MLSPGDSITVTVDKAAHGGEGLARHDGMAVFVQGAVPGDTVEAKLVTVKKNFARARATSVVTASLIRVDHRCAAAAAGAGCCDYSIVDPQAELSMKTGIVREQLQRIGKVAVIPDFEEQPLHPQVGWRTRFRLGVNAQGRPGFRASHSNDIITGKTCAQAPAGLLDDILASSSYTPGAELIVAVGSTGERTVVESYKAARGRSVSRKIRHVSGPATVTQTVYGATFELDPLGFWQGHSAAPEAYCDIVAQWLGEIDLGSEPVVWDLYGGVGLFVPAIRRALPSSRVISVELGKHAAEVGKKALGEERIEFVTGDVAKVVDKLEAPDAVVLDPPRKGAGREVIAAVAARSPKAVIHVGCDPATMARDMLEWQERGYVLRRVRVFDAFPGTHHSETFCFLTRD